MVDDAVPIGLEGPWPELPRDNQVFQIGEPFRGELPHREATGRRRYFPVLEPVYESVSLAPSLLNPYRADFEPLCPLFPGSSGTGPVVAPDLVKTTFNSGSTVLPGHYLTLLSLRSSSAVPAKPSKASSISGR